MMFFATLFSFSINEFLEKNTEPSDLIEKIPLMSNESSLVLIKINGKETYIYSQDIGGALESVDEIKKALINDAYLKRGYQGVVGRALSSLRKFRSGKEDLEGRCDRYLGVDKKPCKDKESCLVACFAVPLCSGVINANGFWEAMLDYTQKKDRLNNELYEAEKILENFEESKLEELVSRLNNIISISSNLSQNGIFLNRTDPGCDRFDSRCFEYCPKINYSTEELVASKNELGALRVLFLSSAEQEERAVKIAQKTAEQKKYFEERIEKFSKLKDSVSKRIQKIVNASDEILRNLTSQELVDGKANLSAIGDEILALGREGDYRQAFGKEDEFEALASNVERKIEELKLRYSNLIKRYEEISKKYASEARFIEPGSEIEELYLSISKSLSSRINNSEIDMKLADIDNLDAKLNKIISEAALSGKSVEAGQVTGNYCPLPIAILLLGFVGALYSLRR
ncbi:MAG: hypothetical protein QXN01_01185 [Candidatus Anstonellales archaeon]